MTVQTTVTRADANGNGVTVAFTVPFYFLDSTHLQVIRTQISTGVATTLALTTDYTVTGAGVPAGGTVTLLVTPTAGQRISILRNVPFTQLAHYVPNDPFPAATHEQIVDQLTMEVQQLAEENDRALTLPPNSTGVSTVMPTPEANKFVAWNAAGTALQNLDPGTLATVVAFGTARADIFTGTGAQTTFTLSANPGAQANLDVSIGGVTQYPGLDYTWSGGTSVVFSAAPANGVKILLRYFQGLPQGTTDSAASTFLPAGTGAVARTAQSKLRETVSPQDFGADETGVTDATAAVQAAIIYAVSNKLNLVCNKRSKFKISASLIIPQHFSYYYEPITLDFGWSSFLMAADVPLFTSGYPNASSSNYGTALGAYPSNGITLERVYVESSIGNIASPVVKIQDWYQGTLIRGIVSGVNRRMILANNCFYSKFSHIQGTGGNSATPMNEFSNNCNLMSLSNFVAVGCSIQYRFTGPVTALVLREMSFENNVNSIGAQFDAYVYDLCIEDSYCEIAPGLSYTMLKFADSVFGAVLKNNYLNFSSNPNAYAVDYLPGPTNNIRIETSNSFVNLYSNGNIVKTREDLYGRGVIIERHTVQGVLADTLVDNSVLGANIDWRQKIGLPSGAIANVVNGIIPGNYSGSYATTFYDLATGFTNASTGTTLRLNTKIKYALSMRIYIALHFVINGVDSYTFGEFVPTGYNSFTYFEFAASISASVKINATNVGGLVQINGTAGTNGLGTANTITNVTGEVRVI